MAHYLKEKDIFLNLIRLGIGHNAGSIHDEVDWSTIGALAAQQGLSAIILDGINCLPEIARPPKDELLQWIGSIIQNYEYRYIAYQKAIAGLAGWYDAHGYKMMVLKGYACSIDWPKPEHRPCGDIDIWLFGKQKEADALLAKDKGVKVDASHHHHTVFDWFGFTVENHYDFINVHHHKSNVAFETILKEQGQDDSNFVELNSQKLYLPSSNLHALFLLKHLSRHFAASEINLRQILDWAFFLKSHGDNVDWLWLEKIISEYGMKELYGIINAICVEDLGFDSRFFHFVKYDSDMKENVLNDILSPKFPREMPNGFIRRVFFKIKRWKSNEWKHKLSYNESMWSAFWSGVKSHLLKPSSI